MAVPTADSLVEQHFQKSLTAPTVQSTGRVPIEDWELEYLNILESVIQESETRRAAAGVVSLDMQSQKAAGYCNHSKEHIEYRRSRISYQYSYKYPTPYQLHESVTSGDQNPLQSTFTSADPHQDPYPSYVYQDTSSAMSSFNALQSSIHHHHPSSTLIFN